jgi:hypothetical protein
VSRDIAIYNFAIFQTTKNAITEVYVRTLQMQYREPAKPAYLWELSNVPKATSEVT